MMRSLNLRREVALIICPELNYGPTSAFSMSGHIRADAPVMPLSDVLAERRQKRVSQRSVGPCRGGSRPDRDVPHHAIGQGVPRPSTFQRLRALNNRIEDSWVGDLIGVAALAALVVAMSFIVGML